MQYGPPPMPPAPPRVALSTAGFGDDFSHGLSGWIPNLWATTGRRQLQCYAKGYARTGRDGLHLVVERAPSNAPPYCKGQPYISTRLQSAKEFTYGTLTVRAKLPAGAGLWPAIWMRTPTGRPLNAEIDVVEGFGSRPDTYQSTVHGWAADKHLGSGCAMVFSGIPDLIFSTRHHCVPAVPNLASRFDAEFHNFIIEWKPDSIVWSVDGQPYHTETQFVPSTPMAIVLELQVGGGFDVDPNAETPIPAEMDVRWVRFTPAQ